MDRGNAGATREGEDTPKLDQAERGNIEARGAGLGGEVKGSAAEGATRSNTEARGAGLGVVVKGGAAEGATRSNTEARGAGLGGVKKGSAAEGATRSNAEARGAGLGGVVKGSAAEGATRSNTGLWNATEDKVEEKGDNFEVGQDCFQLGTKTEYARNVDL